MYWSKTFIPTSKEVSEDTESLSHQLMLRAGLIRMLSSGVYSYLPLGFKVLSNIENIIRQEMNSCAASEVLLPALQPEELWHRSGRSQQMGQVMIRFTDRRGRRMCLGPTHEEVITDLVKSYISSYRQLPLILYQIQTKFRDEIRPRFGLVRACEFIMKDAYSFDRDKNGLNNSYNLIYDAYRRIFKRCGLKFLSIEADPGVMGGSQSAEFMVPAQAAEDTVLLCQSCGSARAFKEDEQQPECLSCKGRLQKVSALEIGHIFKLDTKYSQALGAKFLDEQGRLSPIVMGCYGIGVSRLIPAIIEQNHDAEGIIWPAEVAPYKASVIPIDIGQEGIMRQAQDIYTQLNKEKIEVILDDRDERAGVKFKDADLIGIPAKIILGTRSLKDGNIEIKFRKDKQTLFTRIEQLGESLRQARGFN
jgi:prolyl-tRNA synthetase